ncbi:MAG: SDR family oxidoreductase [Gammaproteobacteria bacterium]|nr:SDR family oxidoreductase [Gammaproteobacteria bacterium]MBU1775916.1 SDR family oxidoreductase [Gammaproteobacteria bacterium]MBU1968147.1 SDR family oxidoreductase [Gammaproteobacteria bacterium]
MERLLIIGCGDVARRTIPQLSRRYRLFALVRNDKQLAWLKAHKVVAVHGDLDDSASLSRLAGLADTVLHLAPPPKVGSRDTCTRHLLAALSQGTLPRRLIYISTSGVYGDCADAFVSETHPLKPQSPRAERRVDAERQIRRWAARNGVKASILRVPGIYAQDRMPLNRLRVSMPTIVAEEDSYTNHINGDDLARIIVAAMRHGKPNRTYNASDDSAQKMGDWLDAVADAHRLRRPPRITRAEAQRVLPDTLLSFMNESRRLVNLRMKRELKVSLRYPTATDLLRPIG